MATPTPMPGGVGVPIEKVGGILGGVGKGVLDFITGGNKEVAQHDIPGLAGTKTQDLANSAISAADKSALQLANEKMAGADQTQALQASLAASQPAQDALASQMDPAVTTALNKRAEKSYASDLNRLQRQQEVRGEYEKARLAGRAFQVQKAVSDLEIKRADFYRRQLENKKAMRNNVISSLFGGIGAMAGMAGGMMLGGPAGASAGGQLGGALGGSMNPAKPIDMGTQPQPGSSSSAYEPLGEY